MTKDPYVYPGSNVLRNKLGISDPNAFAAMERQLVLQRAREGVPSGNFDLAHLRAIHRHLFQDVYDWAGELRTVEIAKSGEQFQFRRYIATGVADVHRRLKEQNYLRDLPAAEFCKQAGIIMGDVNYVHPFREGNGRTQLQYLAQLAERADHPIDLARFPTDGWIGASRAAHATDYRPMQQAILSALKEKP